jgi:aryl-alcohol dehydrogenase
MVTRTNKTSGQAIRAAVLRRLGGPLTIERLELEPPRPDEVLVRVVASGVCHTDIAFVDEWFDGDAPLVLGHEGAGVVERIGEGVTEVRPGDHVVLSFASCGRCPACDSGHPTHCRRFYEANFGFGRLDGSNALEASGVRGHFFGQSSFATHLLTTVRNLVPVANDLPLELLAPLGCGLQTGAGTVLNSLAVPRGSSLAVFGSGAVGLAAIMAARICGAHPLIAVDIVPHRLQLALELGASHAIDGRDGDLLARLAKITGSGVDFVVETSGAAGMEELAVAALNRQGTAAFVASATGRGGLPGGRKAIGIIQGDAVPQRFIPRLIELYRAGQFPFDRLVRFYEFADINQAMDDARNGKTFKPVLRIGKP